MCPNENCHWVRVRVRWARKCGRVSPQSAAIESTRDQDQASPRPVEALLDLVSSARPSGMVGNALPRLATGVGQGREAVPRRPVPLLLHKLQVDRALASRPATVDHDRVTGNQ
jgi:hypothetical protein